MTTKKMMLTLIISDNCSACEKAKGVLRNIKLKKTTISIEIVHINSYNGKKISITPALLIDQKLFSYGDIDEAILSKKLN